MELEKENEKLEGHIKTGINANQNLSSLIIGLTADNNRLTEDNKKLAELNSKLYDENLKLTKDKQHLWEDVVTLKKNDDYTHALRERVDELEERCNTYLEFIEKLRKATMHVGDIAEFGLKKECVDAIDKLNAMVVEIQENMLWCDDIEDDDEEDEDDE